jgi:hypothetical protein
VTDSQRTAVEDSKPKDSVEMHGGKDYRNYRAGSGRNSARVDGNDFEVLCIAAAPDARGNDRKIKTIRAEVSGRHARLQGLTSLRWS